MLLLPTAVLWIVSSPSLLFPLFYLVLLSFLFWHCVGVALLAFLTCFPMMFD
ncbi:hypothetical protein AMATHDRAFT_68401 [Amanita thiersii Skay4041]|uniref:Uncharacterized protein n=1 Tax=Amanita thiersii Skay4041 TaxID=703135 RepID=A0A2A9NFT3_9AGAR|nr:hypothetical protein AMATHDRAFT_68401 [Amanita thiersii Skay4041]